MCVDNIIAVAALPVCFDFIQAQQFLVVSERAPVTIIDITAMRQLSLAVVDVAAEIAPQDASVQIYREERNSGHQN